MWSSDQLRVAERVAQPEMRSGGSDHRKKGEEDMTAVEKPRAGVHLQVGVKPKVRVVGCAAICAVQVTGKDDTGSREEGKRGMTKRFPSKKRSVTSVYNSLSFGQKAP